MRRRKKREARDECYHWCENEEIKKTKKFSSSTQYEYTLFFIMIIIIVEKINRQLRKILLFLRMNGWEKVQW